MQKFYTDFMIDKLGIKPLRDAEDETWLQKKMGHVLEDLVAEVFSRKTDLKVFEVKKMFSHPLYPFMRADVDRFVIDKDGRTGILECKTTNYQNKYNCIVVKDLSRFGRNHLEAAYYIHKFFPQFNTRFIAINDNYDSLQGNTALEDILLPIKNLINENYAREASRKVGISRRNIMDKGLFISAFAPFGYKKSETKVGRLEIDEEVAPIVRRVFDMFVNQDMSIIEISRQLNDEGVISPAQYKTQNGISKNKRWANAVWSTHTVKIMLSNPLYVGYLVLGKTKIDMYRNEPLRITKQEERNIIPNAHKSIVSDEIFELAKRKLEKSAHGKKGEKRLVPYVFNNLYCGCCGTKLSKQYRLDSEDNVNLIFYSCPSDYRGKQTHCAFKKINEDELCHVVYGSELFEKLGYKQVEKNQVIINPKLLKR